MKLLSNVVAISLLLKFRLERHTPLISLQALDPIPFEGGTGGLTDDVRSDGGLNDATTDEDEAGAPSSDDATDDAADTSSGAGAGDGSGSGS